jgi:hypothetical protein
VAIELTIGAAGAEDELNPILNHNSSFLNLPLIHSQKKGYHLMVNPIWLKVLEGI